MLTLLQISEMGFHVKGEVVTYSDGDQEVTVHGSYPEFGRVVTYSDGLSETTIPVRRV